MEPTITLAEANRITEANAERMLTALPDGARLKPFSKYEEVACDDPDDGGPAGRKFAERSYQITGLDSTKTAEYHDKLRDWWLDHDFEILREFPTEGDRLISVENSADGFRMSYETNEHGEMYLNSSSPCVWTNGTPEPE
ncbi:MAG: hypothetical protein GEU86_15155 [Actinophytocola sp.]|nr:hypothetical protein [Actinophytocola sp.]